VMTINFFTKEMIEALRKPRSMVLKLIFPSLIVIPLIASDAPCSVAAGVIVMLTLMIGVFGAGVGLTKDRTDGIMQRTLITPVRSTNVILSHLAAGVFVEILQLSPVIIALFVMNAKSHADITAIAMLVAITGLTVVSANALGFFASAFASSSGEIHLYSVLIIFPIIGISGVFQAQSSSNSALAKVSLISPLTYFYQGLLKVLGQSSAMGYTQLFVGAVAVMVVLLTVSCVFSNRILHRELT
jgi:ABC-2 type transport system permease protein